MTDSFDNVSSFPRKYVIISVAILYIIINLVEYYIVKTSPTETPATEKILTRNELLSDAIFVLKNVSLVILILCILPLVDPLPIVTNIIFGKTINTKKHLHILNILNKYIVNTNRTNDVSQDYNRLKQVSEDLQEHITKVNSLELYDSNNNKTTISDIVHNLSQEVNSNWKKIQNKYWLPVSENVTKFRAYIKRSDALELIERKFYVEGGILQSEMTYNIKVLEKIGSNPDLINYFFTTDLIYNLNKSSIQEIYGGLIEYYYEAKMLNPESDSGYLKSFKETIKSLCLNSDLKKNVIDTIKIFKSSKIFSTETSLNDNTINYYTQFTKNIYVTNSKKLDSDFVKQFNSNGEIKINMDALVESLYNCMIKKYPYLMKKHIFLTKEAYEMYSSSNMSNINIKSIIDYSKFKDLHLSKQIEFMQEKLIGNIEDLDPVNSHFLNKIKHTYTNLNNNNIDELFNWFKYNINSSKETQYYSYLHLLNSTKLNDTTLKQNHSDSEDEITDMISRMSSYIKNKVTDFALNENFPSKTALDQGINIEKILKDLKELVDEHITKNIKDETEKKTYHEIIHTANKILEYIKYSKYSPWLNRHIKLKTATMIYELKLKLINDDKWDHLVNPLPYKDYKDIVIKVERFMGRIDRLKAEKEVYLAKQTEQPLPIEPMQIGGQFAKTLSTEEVRDIKSIKSKINTYTSDINLTKDVRDDYLNLQNDINVYSNIAKENDLYNKDEGSEEEDGAEPGAEKLKEGEGDEELKEGEGAEKLKAKLGAEEDNEEGEGDEKLKAKLGAEEDDEEGEGDEKLKAKLGAEEDDEEGERDGDRIQGQVLQGHHTKPGAEEPSSDPPPPKEINSNQFGGEGTKHDVNALKTDCDKGIAQIHNIEKARLDILNGLNYDIKSFNDAFFNDATEHPITILNINIGNIFCILFNIVYLLLVLKSKKEFQGYKKFSIYSFYAVSMLYVLNYDKTLNHIMNNVQICKFVPYLIIFRTILYIYMTMYDNYIKTAYDVNNDTPFELSISRKEDGSIGDVTEENPNKKMFMAAKLLSSSADLITLILLILIILNYIKPIVLSKHCNDIIEIFDFDVESNSIRNKIQLNFSITDSFELNKTIFNTQPIGEKLLILYDNMNLNNDNRMYFYANIIWKLIGFLLIMQIFNKLKTTYSAKLDNNKVLVIVEDSKVELNTKENMSKYTKFDFDDKEFRDIVIAYLIVIFLMFGPNYMTIISNINLYFLNNFNPPTYGLNLFIFELYTISKRDTLKTLGFGGGGIILGLIIAPIVKALNWGIGADWGATMMIGACTGMTLGLTALVSTESPLKKIIFEKFIYLFIVCVISITSYFILYIPTRRVMEKINNKAGYVHGIFFDESIYQVVLYELLAFIIIGVVCQMIYVENSGDRSSLYYNYDTLDIINNFNNIINIDKVGSIQTGGSIGKILNNYKNIFTILILCVIIFILNKIKKNPKNIMNKKKKDKIQKGGNEFFTTFIYKHLLGDTTVTTNEENDYIREITISILIIVIMGVLMKLGISNSIINQLEKEIFYESNYILLLVLIMIPSCRYIYTLYNSYIENKSNIKLTEYIKYHFDIKYTKIKKKDDTYLEPSKQYELHDSKLELKIHTLLAAIIGIFLSLALNLTNNTKHTIIISISIIIFLILSNFSAYIIWSAFIKESGSLFGSNNSSPGVLIKYISKNIEENGKIISTNNNINKEEEIIINKVKTDIIKDINKIKTSFNIKENLVIGLDNILNKWIYERYTHKSSGTYVDTVELRKNLNKLNSSVKLDNKQEDEKEILNRHEEYKNLYDGVWEKTTNNEKKNIIERILIKTYGSRHAIGMSFNSAGYIVKKYNLRTSILNEASNGKNNIKLYDINNPDFVLSTEDINNVKYINYEKYNSYYKKLIDMGSDIKNIETFLNSSNDFFKKINYILDPIKDVSYIIKYKLLEDFNEYRKIENDANKKCLSSLLIQRIYKKILLIKCITEEKYEEAEQLQNDLNVIEIKYNDLSLLSINRNDISLVTHKVQDNINKINIYMTNLIGNVLKFKNITDVEVLEHAHKHIDNDDHEHTVEFFEEQKRKLESSKKAAKDRGDTNEENRLIKEINITEKNLKEARAMLPNTTKKTFTSNIGSNNEHSHKHIHIKKGPEQSSDVKEDCPLSVIEVPEDIYGIMVHQDINGIMTHNTNIKTYKYDIDNEEHQLILSDNIKSNELETIVSSLTTLKFTNFYTGHLEFNLEYIEDNKEKSKPYKINLLGKDAILELEKPLSVKTKSYLKNIKVEGYYFDSDADNRCETTLVVKNNISSLIIDTYDMTDEFCI